MTETLTPKLTPPSIGRIVLYTLSAQDASSIASRRADAQRNLTEHKEAATGVQIHVGNSVREGDTFPLVVVRVWPNDSVNGQLMLDGNDTYWVMSKAQGDSAGTWSWPPRV